jgi:cysteinyl-tRNA synthetase
MSLSLYDSTQKCKVEFTPIDNNLVRVYVCGPTVYDNAHLGHARSAVAFDLLHRVLKANGFEVQMAKNFTDIDDKILKKLEESRQTFEELTNYYIDSYQDDMKKLCILPNSIEPKATENIDAMVGMVTTLLEKEVAYTTSDGVYFDTSKDDQYGTISNKIGSDCELESRIDTNLEKRNQKDFALWKFDTSSIYFNAPFGDGRPGWHLECSAMINKHMNSQSSEYMIDIHGGGADLLFPHHENEASQTRCATNQQLAKYWMHNGFVTINNTKMSKSLGNSFFLKDLFSEFPAESVRFYLLSSSYRADFNFSTDDLIASKKRLDKLYRVEKRVYGLKLKNRTDSLKQKLLEVINDDLNSSSAFATLDEFLSWANEELDKTPKDKSIKQQILSGLEDIRELIGVGYQNPYEYFQFGISNTDKKHIEELIKKRADAKSNKQFDVADSIREKLSDMNIAIMDTPNGTLWERAI